MTNRTYDDAVDLLNTLQTPIELIKERLKPGSTYYENANKELRRCLTHIGYSQQDLEKLNIIHVAGTKGKGTTCAYVDSILSHYKKAHHVPKSIGLFTSPHLIAVRERIRINSSPISAALFAKYFFEVWDALDAAKAVDSFETPVYFRFLTLMSWHVFLSEGVDTAIYEVGLGGEYDSTNIVDRPAVTGISRLGIDHVAILGSTIDKIAWNKAGIWKTGVPAFTVDQVPEAMEVVKQRAQERNVESLSVVGVDPRLNGVKIRPDAEFQKSNASLAIALADTVLKKLESSYSSSKDSLPKEFVDGLEQTVWRGRCETKIDGNITWYLDGAHTLDSIKIAAEWFSKESSRKSAKRVLIFNQHGLREAMQLLEQLFSTITKEALVHFDQVIFCTNAARQDRSTTKDLVNNIYDSAVIASLEHQRSFADKWRSLDPSSSTEIHVLSSIEDAFDHVRGLSSEAGETEGVDVFITGSIHLIGRALSIIEGVDAL
ncbi:Mur ligase [Xylogone sp. PMI_703]|nr:Mur ligase [Xylogone sp. PMI_703]